MQHDPTTVNAHTTPWKNQGSLGFSTWQRHARLSLTEGGRGDADALENPSGGGNDRGGIRAIYKRHASFAEDLIARRHPQNTSVADPGRFIYTSPVTRLQRYSHPAASPGQPQPAATAVLRRRQPNHGLFQPTNQRIVTDATAANPARSQLDSQAVNRVTESGRSPIPVPPSSHNRVDGSGKHGLPFSSSVGGDTQAGSQTAAILPSNNRISGEGSIGLPRSSTGSSASGIKGGAPLAISQQRSSTFATWPLISRSLMMPGIIHRLAHSDERIRRSYKQASIEPGSNTEAGWRFNTGLFRSIRSAVQNLSPGYVERQGSSQHLQPSTSRTLPLIPLVTETGSIFRSATHIATAPVRQRHDISDRFSPPASSIFSQPNWTMPGRIPAILATPNKIRRKQAVDGTPKIEPTSHESLNSMKESSQMVAGTSAPSGASNSRSTGLSVTEASESSDEGTNESHEPGISRGETSGSISYALRRVMDTSHTASPALALGGTGGRKTARTGLTAGTQDSIALTHSTPMILSSSVAADNRADVAPYPTRDDGRMNTPSHARIQSAQLHGLPHAHQPHGEEGGGEYAGPGIYEAGRQPAVQRWLNKTSPLAAHRRIVTTQPSVSSVHSLGVRDTIALSRPSERVLQKKPVSLLTARARQLDQPVIPGAAHILQRMDTSLERSAANDSMNHGINYSEPAMPDTTGRGVSATDGETRSNLLSPAFLLPLSSQRGIAKSSDIDAVDIGADWSPYRASIGSSRSRSTPVASSGAADSSYHIQGSLRLKPLASASSFDRVMRRMTHRSIEQQRPSMSSGNDISTSGSVEHYNASVGTMHSISESPSGWAPHDRPLVVLQRAQDKVVQRDAIPAAPEHSEDRYGVVSPPGQPGNATVARTGEGNKAQQSGAGQIDAEEIAGQVWRIMAERLVVEQERRGLAKWP